MLNSDNNSSSLNENTPEPASTVVTTFNGDGQEVGVYYAIPDVSLNPGFTDSDLFQDMPMRNAVGEEFTWVENLFEGPDGTTEGADGIFGGVGRANGAMPVTMPETNASNNNNTATINPNTLSTSGMMDQWSSNYSPFDNSNNNGNEGTGGLNQ